MSKTFPDTLADKLLVLETALWLIFVRLLIRFIPFGYWSNYMGARQDEAVSALPLSAEVQEQTVAVQRALAFTVSRLPGKARRFNCLTQALAGKWMFKRRGIPSTLHIGVGRVDAAISDHFRIQAHAWLRSGNRIITGGGPLAPNVQEIASFGSHDAIR